MYARFNMIFSRLSYRLGLLTKPSLCMVNKLMDRSQNLPFIAVIALLGTLLSGCETHLNSEPLQLIGEPPKVAYFDSEFGYQFGASGGDGLYKYRYIPNPESRTRSESDIENYLSLTMTPLDENKPNSWLWGLVTLPPGQSFATVSEMELTYEVEVSDGSSRVRKEFELTLKKNKLQTTGGLQRMAEGSTNVTQLLTMQGQRREGNLSVCRQAEETAVRSRIVNGQQVHPYAISVNLEYPSTRRTEIKYRVKSEYTATSSELSKANIKNARPNVDYIDEVRTIVFQPNEVQCFVMVEIIDDNLKEHDEEIEMEFFDVQGGLIDVEDASFDILLTDNEPRVLYSPKVATINEGESIQGVFELTDPYSLPVEIYVEPDFDATTATADDFALTPSNGVVVIPPGQTRGTFSVSALSNDDTGQTEDDIVVVSTSLDSFLNEDDEKMTIGINEWHFSREVIAREASGKSVVSSTFSGGRLVVLSQARGVLDQNRGFSVDFYDIQGVPTGERFDYFLQGVDLNAKGFARNSDDASIVVVTEVASQLPGASHYGGVDIGLIKFTQGNQGVYSFSAMNQFGTSADDMISGVSVDGAGETYYVHGYTEGEEFENEPGSQVNEGLRDGFVYMFGTNLTKSWSRLAGTPLNDEVAAVAPASTELFLISKNTGSITNGSIAPITKAGEPRQFVVDSTTGETLDRIQVRSSTNDQVVAGAVLSSGTLIGSLFNSRSDLPDNDPTDSFSLDSFLLLHDTETAELKGRIVVSTVRDETASSLEVLNNAFAVAIGGSTLGEFPDQLSYGADNRDAFVAVSDFEVSSQLTLSKVVQFGTSGNDEVITINRVNDHKFMVLWAENASSGDGSKVYRASPFSIEGRKLTLDPQ